MPWLLITAQPARPGSIDRGSGHGAAIGRRIVAAVQYMVIGHDHAHRRVELTEAAQYPILVHFLVIAPVPSFQTATL